MKKIGYARTSTIEQIAGIEKQVIDLEAYGCETVFREHVSSVNDHRTQLDLAIGVLSNNDTLVVTTMSRLCRRTSDLAEIQQKLESKGAGLEILDLRLDTSTAIGRMTLTIIASVAQMERELMLERQAVGIAKAKAEGKYKGKKPTATSPDRTRELRKHLDRGLSVVEASKLMGISRASGYRLIKLLEPLP